MRTRAVKGATLLGVAYGGVLGFGAAGAGAATLIGSDLARAPGTNATAPLNVVPVSRATPSTLPVEAPTGGALVGVRVRHSATTITPGTFSFRIFTGTASPFTARGQAQFGTLEWPTNIAAGTLSVVPLDANGLPRGVPIVAGERLGIRAVVGDQPNYLVGGVGGQLAIRGADHTDAQSYANIDPTLAGELAVQGRIEPDADGDAYGDESQDRCVGTAGPCHGVPTTVTNTVTRPVEVVRTVAPPTFGPRVRVALALAATRVRPGRRFTVVLRNTNPFRVRGELSVATKDRFDVRISKRQRVQLAAKRLSIPAGGSQRVSVALPDGVRQAFRRRGRLALALNATLRDPAGAERTVKAGPVLRRR